MDMERTMLEYGARRRWGWILLPLLLVFAGCHSEQPNRLAGETTIYRDHFGVPHVSAASDAGAAFGFGYAQAEDNLYQVEDNFIRALGRASEVNGERTLAEDWLNRALEIPRLAQEEYRHSSSRIRALLDGYAAGLNFYIKKHPEVKTRLLRHFEPWYPLALIRYLYYQRGFLRAARLGPDVYREAIERSAEANLAVIPDLELPLLPRSEQGSNSWAIGREHSLDSTSYLFINPHLPFFGPAQVYEGHVMSDEGWNYSGYTRFGFPFPYVGFNEELGWASTDNAADMTDVYVENFDDPSDRLAYRYGDEYREAEQWQESIGVRSGNTVAMRAFTFVKTHHGPVVGYQDGRAMSVKMAKLASGGWIDEWYAMTQASTLDQFREATSRLDMLFGNYLYADRAGNILYVYNAAVPRRSDQFDWSRPVDGSNPDTEWRGFHTVDELPQILNPASGWLQNCNGSPFLASSVDNPDPASFPSYMVPDDDNARSIRSRKILSGIKKIRYADVARLAYDTHLAQADEDVPAIVREAAVLPWMNPERHEKVKDAVDLLKKWNRNSSTESEAMTLYVYWSERMARFGSNDRYSNTKVLSEVMDQLISEWGTWQVPWGEVNRLQRIPPGADTDDFDEDAPSIPIAGAPSWAGGMFTFWSVPGPSQRRRYGVGGNTYVSVVAFGKNVVARSLYPFGASADSTSGHYLDQAARYAVGDFKSAWLTLDDVQEHAAESYQPGNEIR